MTKKKKRTGTSTAGELRKARALVKDLRGRIADASITLYDWDGYFDEENLVGDAPRLAALIEDAYIIMQGRTWTGRPRLWKEIHRREDEAKKTKKKKGRKQ